MRTRTNTLVTSRAILKDVQALRALTATHLAQRPPDKSMLLRGQDKRSGTGAGAGNAAGRRQRGEIHHERKPSLEPGVLRMYKWEGPGGRGESCGEEMSEAHYENSKNGY